MSQKERDAFNALKRIYARKYRAKNKDKISEYQKNWRKNNKQQNYNNHNKLKKSKKTRVVELMGNKCKDCKKSYPLECYDFHHVNPKDKDNTVSWLLHCSWARIIKEVKKCVLLCANCHRIRHSKGTSKRSKK